MQQPSQNASLPEILYATYLFVFLATFLGCIVPLSHQES